MSQPHIDIDALARIIKNRLHSSVCPGQGALGELAYITQEGVDDGTPYYQAWMYAWSDDLTSTEVARWFTEAGCTNVNIFHQLHDPDNDISEGRSTLDGVRPLMIYFSAKVLPFPADQKEAQAWKH